MSTAGSARHAGFRVGGPLAAAALILFTLGAAGASAEPAGDPASDDRCPRRGPSPRRGAAGWRSGDPNLVWHNGAIMTSSVVKAIFWGSSWGSSGDKISGLDRFYGAIGGSSYMKTNTEYTGTNGTVGTAVTYQGHVVDTTSVGRRTPDTAAIEAEVARMITNPVANGYYPVYRISRAAMPGIAPGTATGASGGPRPVRLLLQA